MSECMELACNITESMDVSDLPKSLDEARSIVRKELQDESEQLIDNVAESLFRYAKQKRR